jgi:hypothetical protein
MPFCEKALVFTSRKRTIVAETGTEIDNSVITGTIILL